MKDLNYFTRRMKVYSIITLIGAVLLLGSIFLFFPIIFLTDGNEVLIILPAFFFGGIISILGGRQFNYFSTRFKEQYIPEVMTEMYPDYQFKLNEGFDEHEIYDSHVLSRQDRFYSGDMLTGNFEGVSFKSADVKLYDRRRTANGTKFKAVFQGRVYKFNFNKQFKANVLVNQPIFLSKINGFEKVQTESIEFNSELSIYSNHPQDALYILTPNFMERLLRLDKKYNNKIGFTFVNDSLYIAINNDQDLFEATIFKPLDKSVIEDFKQQFIDIKSFISELNLEQNLFKNID